MEYIKAQIDYLEKIANNPAGQVKKFIQEENAPVIGCLPIYIPEEIIHAGGMLPVGLWGGQTEVMKAHTYMQSFACSIMQAVMEFAVRGVYNDLSAVIIPAYCDTLKCVGENWKVAVPQVPCMGLVYPQNRKIESGVKFLQAEFEHVRCELEKITGRVISNSAIQESIEVYNQHRQTMAEFCETAVDYPNIITPKVRHNIIKAGYFIRKEKHNLIVRQIIDELRKKQPEVGGDIRVILTGIIAEPDGLLDLFAENGITVVADDLAQESRQFRTMVPSGVDPIERLARRWSLMEGCSVVYDPTKKKGEILTALSRQYKAHGIIVCMMKFCEPEEFDYPIYKKQLEQEGIPHLYLEMEQQVQSVEQLRTRIQGFTEMLQLKK